MLAHSTVASRRPKNRNTKNSSVDDKYPMAMLAADCFSDSMPITAPKFIRNSALNTPVPTPYAVTNARPSSPVVLSSAAPRMSNVLTAMPAGNR